MAMNYLYRMNSTQVQKLQKDCNLVFLPMGPTEVHGPHLPLMTDIVSGLELAERASRKLEEKGIKSLIATPITYCHADNTNCFPGNTSLRVETVAALVEDVCISLAAWGFDHIVLVSGHADPTNASAAKQGIENAMARNPKIKGIFSDWYGQGIMEGRALSAFRSPNHPEWDFHAGESETALMMYRFPELLDEEQIRKLPPNNAGEFLFQRIAEGAKDFIECGATDAYFGDPASATAEGGDRQYDIFSDIVVEEALALVGKA